MKVTAATVAAVLVMVCINGASTQQNMFGMGGMVKRRFPGASAESIRTYRSTVAAQGQGLASVVPRTRTAVVPQSTSWMFSNEDSAENEISLRTSFQDSRRTAIQPTVQQQGPFQDTRRNVINQWPFYRYQSSFVPRESYAIIHFPYYPSYPRRQLPIFYY